MAFISFMQLKSMKWQHNLYILTVLCGLLLDQCCGLTCNPIESSNCKCQFDDDAKTVIDFTPISLNNKTPKFPFDFYNTVQRDWLYAFNPCFPFTDSGDCTDMSVCQKSTPSAATPQVFALGDPKPVKWTTNADNNIVISYSHTARTSDVTFKCVETALEPTLEFIEENTVYVFTVNTCLACQQRVKGCPYPSQGSRALNAGGIICILFTVLVVVYIVGGILFQKYARGATGKEMIPNYGFWSDFPALIKDGFLFMLSPCRRDDGYSTI